MAIHKKTSLSRHNPRPRWECESVQLLAYPIDFTEWKYALETVARELYDLSHQLQEVDPVLKVGLNENTLSNSLHHPIEIKTSNLADTSAGEDGVSNGKEQHHAAA